MTIRILLADDHPLIRAGIRSTLATESEFSVVGEACDGNEAQAMSLNLHPDVLLLDLSMSGPLAEETIRIVKSSCADTKIIILTAYDNEVYIRTLIEADISGYILKDEAVEVVTEAIRVVIQGRFWFSQSITAKMTDVWNSETMLTSREFEVLQLAWEGKSNTQIGEEMNITERTVRKHMENIMQKMQVNNRTEAVKTAIQLGWIKV